MVPATNHRRAARGIARGALLGGALHVRRTASRRSYVRSHPATYREPRLAVHRYRFPPCGALPWIEWPAEHHPGLQPRRTSCSPGPDCDAGCRGRGGGMVGNRGLPEPLMRELPLEHLDTDILILGAGGAGLLAAVHAHEISKELRIVIAVKGLLGQSGCTRMVQGGYNAVLNPNDSLERHFADTVKGGASLNHQELAWTLVKEAPDRIIELENRLGCMFDRNADGTIHQKPFAGQSFDRTVHKGDLTGIEIMSNLRDWVFEQPNVTVLEETRGLDFLTAGSRVVGAVLLDNRRGRFIAVTAKATLSATGAGATMYHISSPSLEKAADGQAMAARLGAEFVDMEMMQFHPTGILAGNSIATGGLLEEGLRGAGARLYNALGERYMERYSPDKLERATRDVVSRSGYMEIMAGRGTASGGVLIDATHIPNVAKHFAGMVDRCRELGFDLVNDRVEVSPSSHYHMGGIRIDVNCHTNIEGLFAAGEDAGGVHGANRLGGNGVADSIVFGARAGDTMVEDISRKSLVVSSEVAEQVQSICKRWMQPLERTTGENPFQLRDRMERVMWTNVGVVRDGKDMKEALPEIQEIRERIKYASGSCH